MPDNDLSIHREEFLYLADLTHNSALIAWGAFYFKVLGDSNTGKWELIDDDDLGKFKTSRKDLIGASSAPYAANNTAAQVELIEKDSGSKQTISVFGANHAVFENLKSDTTYSYSVKVNGQLWGTGQLRDWEIEEGNKGFMRPSKFSYENEFRTFPNPANESPDLAFAVLGDFGRGVRSLSKDGQCQREVAASLAQAVKEHKVRLLLSTGDNIYHSKEGSGDEDDDWFFTFFQPYRFIVNRIPVFPAVGNHDEGETFNESSDDRRELYDNMYIRNRFNGKIESGDASLLPGLFYRIRYGADIEFICLDTSKQGWLFEERFFKHDNHQPFINSVLPDEGGRAVKWRIPFFHHPPFCAGPNHSNKRSVADYFVPKFIRAGVRAVFCGHEHNFQHSFDNGINYFVTGGSGKFDLHEPRAHDFEDAKTQAWGGNEEGHFLLVTIAAKQMQVIPYGNLADEKLRPIKINVVKGKQNVPPFKVNLE